MVRHYHKSPTTSQTAESCFEHLLQSSQLIVYLDAQGLEDAGQLFLFFSRRDETAHGLEKLPHGLQSAGKRLPVVDNGCSKTTCLFQFSIVIEEVGQGRGIVFVQDGSCIAAGTSIHSHVQKRTFRTETESALLFVEMM